MSNSTNKNFATLARELDSFLSEEEKADRARALENPEFFITGVLDYQLRPFHRRWFDFQLSNRETLILAPRGHGKSTICTVAYSLWKLLRAPGTRILIVSNTASQADALAGEIKLQTETSAMLRYVFGTLKGASWRSNRFTLAGRTRICKEASVTSVGVDGAIVSRHYDIIILDDVVDEENSRTAGGREKLKTWYAKILLPCLEPEGQLHMLGTRYHPLDLYGTLIAANSEGGKE